MAEEVDGTLSLIGDDGAGQVQLGCVSRAIEFCP